MALCFIIICMTDFFQVLVYCIIFVMCVFDVSHSNKLQLFFFLLYFNLLYFLLFANLPQLLKEELYFNFLVSVNSTQNDVVYVSWKTLYLNLDFPKPRTYFFMEFTDFQEVSLTVVVLLVPFQILNHSTSAHCAQKM